MDLVSRVSQLFLANLELNQKAMPALRHPIAEAGQIIATCLQQQGKILSCGNGGSAEQAQHFSSELINRFEKERQALPAIALTNDSSSLTSIGNDYAFERIFARQIQALGKPGDVLLAISTSGNSPNILTAIEVAHRQQMHIISLTGREGGKVAQQLIETDQEIRVPSQSTARIQEIHLLVIHCLCDLIDEILFENEISKNP
jgi:D-sedoheptulose 7-phosphate isomerase